jgi:hypothetical protein
LPHRNVGARLDWTTIQKFFKCRGSVVRREQSIDTIAVPKQMRKLCITNARDILQDRSEYGLQLAGRGTDDCAARPPLPSAALAPPLVRG